MKYQLIELLLLLFIVLKENLVRSFYFTEFKKQESDLHLFDNEIYIDSARFIWNNSPTTDPFFEDASKGIMLKTVSIGQPGTTYENAPFANDLMNFAINIKDGVNIDLHQIVDYSLCQSKNIHVFRFYLFSVIHQNTFTVGIDSITKSGLTFNLSLRPFPFTVYLQHSQTNELKISINPTSVENLWDEDIKASCTPGSPFNINFKSSFDAYIQHVKVSFVNVSYSKLILGTNPGDPETCDAQNPCLPHHACISGECSTYRIHPSCLRNNQVFPNTPCSSCSPLSEGWKTTDSQCGNIEYADLTQFSTDINIEFPTKFSHSYTMSFWVFNTNREMNDYQFLSVILDDVMMINIGKDIHDRVVCSINLGFYPELKDINSFSELSNLHKSKIYTSRTTRSSQDLTNTWYSIKCSYNMQAKNIYTVIGHSGEYYKSIGYFYDNLSINSEKKLDDTFYYYLGEKMKLQIKRPEQNLGSIYLRNLFLVTDFISINTRMEYFDYSTMVNNSKFKSLLFGVNFNDLSYSQVGSDVEVEFSYNYYLPSNGLRVQEKLNLKTVNLNEMKTLPVGFYRMYFNLPNSKFKNNADFTTEDIACSDTKMLCFDTQFPISCKDGAYLYVSDDFQCVETCPSTSSLGLGTEVSLAPKYGYCSAYCSPNLGNPCVDQNYYNTYMDSLKCENALSLLYLTCVDTPKMNQGALHYSGIHKSQPEINIDIYPNLSSYYFDIWFYRDKMFNLERDIHVAKFYVLYTSAIRIFRTRDDPNDFYIEDSNGELLDSIKIKVFPYNWVRFTFKVSKHTIQDNDTYKFNLMWVTEMQASTSNDLTLTSVQFVNSPNNDVANRWDSGYYRNLRIWDSTLLDDDIFRRYNDFYQMFSFMPSTKANLYYFPMNRNNLLKFKLQDPVTGNYVSPSNIPSSYQILQIRPWNIIGNFEIPSTELDCGDFTTHCLSGSHSLSCVPNAILRNGTCLSPNGAYLQFPYETSKYTFLSLNVNSIALNKMKKFTTMIWLKFFTLRQGLTGCVTLFRLKFDNSKFICVDTDPNSLYALKYIEDKLTSTLFTNESNVILEDKTEFKSKQASWNLITITSYVDLFDKYFFDIYINKVKLKSVIQDGVKLLPPGIDVFDISNNFHGLLSNFTIYDNYIVNPWGFSFNQELTSLTRILFYPLVSQVSREALCLTNSQVNIDTYIENNNGALDIFKFKCTYDIHPFLYLSCPRNTFLNEITMQCEECDQSCTSGCISQNPNDCSCDAFSRQNFLVKSSGNKDISCKDNPNIDIAAVNTTRVTVPSNTNEFSMEFWFNVFTYDYGLSFGGVELIWLAHNYIKIHSIQKTIEDEKKSFIAATCSPLYNDISTYNTTHEPSITQYYDDALGKWQHVICSISLPNQNFTLNDNQTLTKIFSLKRQERIKNVTQLIIQPSNNENINYGMFSIRNLALWSIYNVHQYFSGCKKSGFFFNLSVHSYFSLEKNYNETSPFFLMNTMNKDMNSSISLQNTFFHGYPVLENVPDVQDNNFDELPECAKISFYPPYGYNNSTFFHFWVEEALDVMSYKFYWNETLTASTIFSTIQSSSSPSASSSFQVPTSFLEPNGEKNIYLFCELKYINNTVNIISTEIPIRNIGSITDVNYNEFYSQLLLNTDLPVTDVEKYTSILNNLSVDSPNAFLLNNWMISNKVVLSANDTLKVGSELKCNPNVCNNRGDCYIIGSQLGCICRTNNIVNTPACSLSRDDFDILMPIVGNNNRQISKRITDDPSQLNTAMFNAFRNSINLVSRLMTSTTSLNVQIPFLDRITTIVNSKNQNLNKIITRNLDTMNNALSNAMTNLRMHMVKLISQASTSTGLRLLQDENTTNSTNTQEQNSTLANNTSPSEKLIDSIKTNYNILTNFIKTISKSILYSNDASFYKFSSAEYDLVVQKISVSFNFLTAFNSRRSQMQNYFNATECLMEIQSGNSTYDFSSLYFIFLSFNSPFYLDITEPNKTIGLPHIVEFYDGKKSFINTTLCKVGIAHHFAMISSKSFIDDYNTYPAKYFSGNYNNRNIYQPKYIFPNCTINQLPVANQTKLFYPQYEFVLEKFDLTNNQISLSHQFLFSNVSNGFIEINTNETILLGIIVENTMAEYSYNNWYYLNYFNIYTCGENLLNNACFIFVIVFYGFTVLFQFITVIYEMTCLNKKLKTKKLYNVRRDALFNLCSELDKDNFIFDGARYNIDHGLLLILFEQEKERMKKEEGDQQKDKEKESVALKDRSAARDGAATIIGDIDQKILLPSNTSSTYNIVHFYRNRNIYVNFFTHQSPISTRIKFISKISFLWLLLLKLGGLCIAFDSTSDLKISPWSTGDVVKIIVYAIICSIIANIIFVCFSLFYNDSFGKFEALVDFIINEEYEIFMKTNRKFQQINSRKVYLLNFLNSLILILIYYISTGFCAVWSEFSIVQIVTWLVTILLDFVLNEFIFEYFILLFYKFRTRSFSNNILQFLLKIKSLRNRV